MRIDKCQEWTGEKRARIRNKDCLKLLRKKVIIIIRTTRHKFGKKIKSGQYFIPE